MEKLTGEAKQFWERAFLAALTGQAAFAHDGNNELTTSDVDALIAGETANAALEVWRERCEPAPDYLNMATLCDECGGPIPKPWPTLTPEEQKLADALPDAPAKPACCPHPIEAHGKHGCMVTLTEKDFCNCSVTHDRDEADFDVYYPISVHAPLPEIPATPIVLQADAPTEPPQPEEPEVEF